MRFQLFLFAIVATWSASVAAADYTSSNLQLLHGHGFGDRYTGANSSDRWLTTLTFENLLLRDWGDSFLFVDINHGKLLNFGGERRDRSSQVYAEWQPRLSLGHLAGIDTGSGPVRDVFIATQVNAGDDGFRACLIGVGVDFRVAGFTALGVNLYRRHDTFNAATLQLTAFWNARIGGADSAWSTEGFVDIAGTDRDGTDVMFQPQLLVDLGRLRGSAGGLWQAGIEWYYHHNDALTTSAPQLLVKWRLP